MLIRPLANKFKVVEIKRYSTSYGVPAREKASDSLVPNCPVKDAIGRAGGQGVLAPESQRCSAVNLRETY